MALKSASTHIALAHHSLALFFLLLMSSSMLLLLGVSFNLIDFVADIQKICVWQVIFEAGFNPMRDSTGKFASNHWYLQFRDDWGWWASDADMKCENSASVNDCHWYFKKCLDFANHMVCTAIPCVADESLASDKQRVGCTVCVRCRHGCCGSLT